MHRAKERNIPLGPRYALMVASKICEGMDYAHGLKDLHNNPLNIIHRDLTPQNIFITTPADDSAFSNYNKILKIDPDSARAQAGIQKISDRYASIADLAYRKFDFRGAEEYVRNGLMVVPDHSRLLKLKRELTGTKPETFFKGMEKIIDGLFSD